MSFKNEEGRNEFRKILGHDDCAGLSFTGGGGSKVSASVETPTATPLPISEERQVVVVVPVAYTLLDDFHWKIRNLLKRERAS
jgi:hypothetical protein